MVVDTSGRVVSGSETAGVPLFELPFEQSLVGLRVGVGPGAIAARVDALDNQWRWILTVVLFSTLVTALALWALFRATQQQDRLLLRQREFTTRVTHELKTPLAGIRVMAENVQLGAYRSPQQLENMAGRIIDESDRLTERVNQILHSVRTAQLPRKEPFDPEEAVLEAIDIWGPRLHEASVTLRADLHATPMVLGDSESVRDAVGCLLDNALKYRREEAESTVELRLEAEGRWVTIVVIDNGIGVPAELRKEIFERFVRVEGPHRGLAGGHGLGLAQVRSVARGHGGRVVCTEGTDGGACFTLRLPAIR